MEQWQLALAARNKADALEKKEKAEEEQIASTKKAATNGSPFAVTPHDDELSVTVTASDRTGLHVHADHNSKSATVTTLHRGDRVFLQHETFLNSDPPEPVNWQKVTTSDGQSGWFRADYLSSLAESAHGEEIPTPSVPAPNRLRRCRIISLKPGEMLIVRKGPGADFSEVARYSFHENDLIRVGEGVGQYSSDGDIMWHAVYSPKSKFIGWVEEGHLSKEGD